MNYTETVLKEAENLTGLRIETRQQGSMDSYHFYTHDGKKLVVIVENLREVKLFAAGVAFGLGVYYGRKT